MALIPKHEGSGHGELLDAGQEPRPGIRSQIAVVDYDGDGKLDILLGDYCSYLHVEKDLTPDQRRAFEAIRSEQDKIAEQLRASTDALTRRWMALMKDVPRSDRNTPENRAMFQKMYEEMKESDAYTVLLAKYKQSEKEVQEYVVSDRGNAVVPHGYVWLYRRK